MFKTELTLMIYRHARYMFSGSKMLTEICLMNYRHDRRMSNEFKTLKQRYVRKKNIDNIGAGLT